MPRNTKDLENSKKEELEKKVESKKSAPKATTKQTAKTEKKVENKPTSKMAAAKKSTSTAKSKSTVTPKIEEKTTSAAKKSTSTKVEKTPVVKKVEKKETTSSTSNKKVETKKTEVKKVAPTVKVETKKTATTKTEKVEPKKATAKTETKKVSIPEKAEVKKSETTTTKKVAVKKSTSTPKSKVATNAAKKSTSSKTTVAKASTTKKSTTKVTPISDKVAKSETTKKSTETQKASSKTETIKKATPIVEEKTSKSKIASLADSLFNKIKQFIAGSQKEEDSKKPNRKAKKTLVNQDLTITGLPEYYDLPYKYNDTIVKILAQTPKRLFIYWDISDKDRKSYIKAFGEDFFEKTYPVLLVHNLDKNYTFEVPVNDFANSWYLDINDSKCQYSIELGRKFKAPVELMEDSLEVIKENNIDLRNDYIYITTSNVLEAPNDRILFDKLPTQITFRNVKTMAEYTVDTKEYVNTSSMNKLYDIEDLYKALYKEDNSDEIYDLSNPSSGNPTSTFK